MDDTKKEKSLLYRIWQSTIGKKDSEAEESEIGEAESGNESIVTAGPLDQVSTEEKERPIIAEKPEKLPKDFTAGKVKVLPAEHKSSVQKLPPSETEEADGSSKHTGDVMKVRNNYLEAMRRSVPVRSIKESDEVLFSDFTLTGEEPSGLQKIFLRELQLIAKETILLLEEQKKAALETEEGKPVPKPKPINAQICIKIPADHMSAWMFAFPPQNGGKGISKDLVREALSSSRILFGIDEDTINYVVNQKIYMKLVDVALGVEPVDGIDGELVDYFPRTQRDRYEESEGRSVDYKNLNWLHQITAEAVICDVTLPVESIPGHKVTGELIPGRVVKKINLPAGTNTKLNEDSTALISTIDGTLFFEGGKFQVRDVLNIMSDVDLTVGNIDTIGSVDIKGDVLSGFTVQATGDITVRGMVGNSTIIAAGNIKIGMGIRGNGEARMQAGGNIQCIYMENCEVKARGSINSGSIINCDVVSDSEIESKKIVGGNITALHRIHSKIIGNQQRRQTVFNLGITQETLEEKTRLEEHVSNLEGLIEQEDKNIKFLETKEHLDSGETVLYNEMKLRVEENNRELKICSSRLEEINDAISDISQCEIVANTVYPPVTVSVRNDTLVIDREQAMCRIWCDEGEIRIS